MAKSKKKKNKDFQKVKLKVGKQLKKADNVTTASFQTRRIQVTQKLKSDNSQPSTKRKLNIQELLTQCQHYSISVRHDALMGLRELLTTYPDLLKSNLALVLERSASMFTDKDSAVRQAVIKLLKVVLPMISDRQISSFFPIISAHLCCSMTHIYEDIQSDSLQVLDLLLDAFPKLVISKSGQLLPNFIEQISSSKASGDKNRSLTVNPNRKTSSQKWRTTVLERLHKLLNAVIQYQVTGAEIQGEVSEDLLPEDGKKGIVWTPDMDASFLPLPQSFRSRLDGHGVFIKSNQITKRSSADMSVGLTDEEGIEKFVEVLVPLLMECWVEAEGSHDISRKNSHSSLISQDSLSLRRNVLQVIQLLWQYVERNRPTLMESLHQRYTADFKNKFLQYFPYAVHCPAERKEKANKNKQEDKKPSATSLNLLLCDIMTHFMSCNVGQSEDFVMLPWEMEIFSYLGNVLPEDDLCAQDHQMIVDIVGRLLTRYHNHVQLDNLLQKMLERYTTIHPLSNQRKMLLNFFSGLFTNHCYAHLVNEDMADTFLKTLPQVFFQSYSNQQMAAQILMMMKKMICQTKMSPVAMGTIKTFVDDVLDQSGVIFDKLESVSQKRFIELIYYIPPLPQKSLSSIVRLCRNSKVPVDICVYTLQVLHHRYTKETQNARGVAEYIGTLLSILISPDENSHVMETGDTGAVARCVHRHDNYELHYHFDMELWTRQLSFIKAVCSIFQQFENSSQVAEVLGSFYQKYLDNKDYLSSKNLMALVILANRMDFWKFPIRIFLTKPLCGYIWCLFFILVTNVSEVTDFIEELKTECVQFIVAMETGVECFLDYMACACDGAKEDEDIKRVCQATSILLRSRDISPSLQKYNGTLNNIISSVKMLCPSVLKQQWWSDFLYLVSLVS